MFLIRDFLSSYVNLMLALTWSNVSVHDQYFSNLSITSICSPGALFRTAESLHPFKPRQNRVQYNAVFSFGWFKAYPLLSKWVWKCIWTKFCMFSAHKNNDKMVFFSQYHTDKSQLDCCNGGLCITTQLELNSENPATLSTHQLSISTLYWKNQGIIDFLKSDGPISKTSKYFKCSVIFLI